jgi:hypothetical protein
VLVYVGQTRGAAWIAKMSALGFGECTVRSEFPPRRRPWFFDNGAFLDWRASRPFDGEAFQSALEKVRRFDAPPDFIVVPDIVAGGLDSLAFSLTWRPHLAGIAPLYLAVQDGMTEADVLPHVELFAGLFVGGSVPWKVRTGRHWVDLAHRLGKPCHIGRAGNENKAAWAIKIGADSIDSTLPLRSEENLARFLRAFGPRHPELFAEPTP